MEHDRTPGKDRNEQREFQSGRQLTKTGIERERVEWIPKQNGNMGWG